MPPTKETILSAGIDIGTSTTKLVISRFTLSNTAASSHVPRIEITEKQMIHASPLYRTPLRSRERIDMPEVLQIIRNEYEKAGISPAHIQTGAVIITGETATKQNARELVHMLSAEAGEFLVATAGPDLEGILAAKGSGAYAYAKHTGKTVANIDIGGGTANIAVYRGAELLGTCTLHIGGRLVEYTEDRISYIAPPVQALLAQEPVPEADMASAALQRMVQILVRVLEARVRPGDEVLLLGHPPGWGDCIEEIMFSGGVGACLYHPEQQAPYQDIGLALAQALRESAELQRWTWVQPLETARATVMGAGMQATEISGATIQVQAGCLPLRNVPVYQLNWNGSLADGENRLKQAAGHALALYDPEGAGQPFALCMQGLPRLRFSEVQQLAGWIVQSCCLSFRQSVPVVIVLSSDLAKVMGQTLQLKRPDWRFVCIDQIQVEHGDYIDIGHELQSGVVPVIVKTLAFHT
ncbi:ethanolamine ammonia-lyase reactivating factor EutA [Ectobacillus ponti]|uniref:Ethanolamine ammonia-lyase reactivating factor EutA n=1 Tax=Ectobacillus ponti TaxID=2961894 RepID=A0AA41X7L4_9BACI|nr:ethanolamine ammonia-lyase reactivating factor EutA [Ectobacillus ponti]MCP8970401.1 ethanolamine ammonia-lyase reactivating factor EutA [Ectobacillus ponti]